ncbi:MAG TPA: hypothetical protein EYP85_13145, partial [Armatimonadetes bacterium]|nr:hypothetical protein [Armatimonadota bacterium]
VLPQPGPEYLAPDETSPFATWVAGLPYMRAIGVKWTRLLIGWQFCEPQRGRVSLDPQVQVAQRMRDEGLQVFASFTRVPRWASRAPQGSPHFHLTPPRDWADWERFVRQTVSRLKDYVQVWEVWNEPVIPWGWKGTVEEVVRLHEVAYRAIKSVQPEATVIGPCVGPLTALPQLRQLMERGLARWLDGVALHPYPPTLVGPEEVGYLTYLEAVRAMMATYGGPKDLWFTEIGWLAWPERGFTERDQANVLARMYVQSLAGGVRLVCWRNMVDWKVWDPAGKEGLLRAVRPAVPVAPRPAYVAYGTVTRNLARARYRYSLDWLGASTFGYVFERQGQPILVLWDRQGTRRLTLPMEVNGVEVVDLMGVGRPVAAEGGTVTLLVSPSPIFVHGASSEWLRPGRQMLQVEPLAASTRRGAEVSWEVRVTNPWLHPLEAVLRCDVPQGLSEVSARPMRLAPGETTALRLKSTVAPEAEGGTMLVPVSLVKGDTVLAGRIVVLDLPPVREPEGQHNRVRNPGFEFGISGWWLKPGWHMGDLVSQPVHRGLHAWQMALGEDKDQEQWISTSLGAVDPAKRYRVSVWVRTEGVRAEAPAYVQIQRWLGPGQPGPFHAQGGTDKFLLTWGSSEWRKLAFTVDHLPPHTHSLVLYLRLSARAGGKVWWDDVEVVEIPAQR